MSSLLAWAPSAAGSAGGLERMRSSAGRLVVGRLEWLCLGAGDAGERLRGRDGDLKPPRRLQIQGGRANFDRVGASWLRILEDLGRLRPDSRVLDVGCGPGRIALPLTDHLENGSYEGFDISRAAVRWCQRNISPRYPHFSFRLAEVQNGKYDPRGSVVASEYAFPYPDESFDLALAASSPPRCSRT